MSAEAVESVYDEISISGDSGSSHSDLDHEMSIDVLLPNNTMHKINVLASTPVSDIRTHVCSEFKLSPSLYTVEFVSSSLTTTKRKSSQAIGRLDVTMLKIMAKKTSSKSTSSTPATNVKETTVRLIVRLPRLRQSIIRVKPDVALSTIFSSVCDKLNLNEEARSLVEFCHPIQHDVKLNLKLSLNDYSLREVYLADTRDNSGSSTKAPVRSKRRAPAPPPQAATGSAPDIKSKPDTEKSTPPKPAKRRHAPLPPQPQATAKTDKPAEVSEPEPIYAQVNKKKPTDKKENKSDDMPVEAFSSDEQKTVEEGVDNVEVEESSSSDVIAATLDATDELDKVLDEIESNHSHEITEHSDDDNESIPEILKISKEDPPTSQDELKDHVDDTTQNDVKEREIKAESPTPVETKTLQSEIIIYDVVDDEIKFNDDRDVDDPKKDSASDHGDTKELTDEENKPVIVDHVPSIKTTNDIVEEVKEEVNPADEQWEVLDADELPQKTEAAVKQSEDDTPIVITPAVYVDRLSADEDSFPPPPAFFLSDCNNSDPLPPPPEDFSDPKQATSVVETIVIPKPSVQPKPQVVSGPTVPVTLKEESDFDLHIAESLGITDAPIANGSAKLENSSKRTKSLGEFITDENSNPIVNKTTTTTNNEKKVENEEISDVDKTISEIEKLHLQIRRMKNRNSVKQSQRSESWQMLKEGNRNSWHPGTKSFVFVPNKAKEVSHEDYKEAVVPGIQLSNDGEIKALHNDASAKSSSTLPNPEADKARPRSTLPSYYKKFLGANAFAQTTK